MGIKGLTTHYLNKTSSAAPLAVFRICFGLMVLGSICRFWGKGWIQDLYIKPQYFFPYYGFEFIKPLGEYTYILFYLWLLCLIGGFGFVLSGGYRGFIFEFYLYRID